MARDRIRLDDIAKACGVSRQTVGFILGDRGQLFRPETQALVRDTATRLGWRAPGKPLGRTHFIALLQDGNGYRSELNRELLLNLEAAVRAHDWLLVFTMLSDEHLPRVVDQVLAEGLLLNYHGRIPLELAASIAEHRIPTVHLNTKLPHDAVYPDEAGLGSSLARRLLADGHRRIAWIRWLPAGADDEWVPAHFSLLDQIAGFQSVMRDAGLVPRILTCRFHEQHTALVAEYLRVLSTAESFDALIAPDGGTKFIALYAACRELRLTPQLATIDQQPNEVSVPVLRAIKPWPQVADRAVAMLARHIREGHGQVSEAVPATVVLDSP